MLSILVPVVAFVWGVHTWSVQRQDEMRLEHEKRAALYGNPFLLACDDLQSRLYKLLGDEATYDVLRAHYPGGQYAEETLYLMFQYFGWERHVFRYGPYSVDSNVITLTSQIRDTFASSRKFDIGPFCFFRTEQTALGASVMKQVVTEDGNTVETVPFFEFYREMQEPPLSEVRSVKQSCEAIRNAPTSTELKGRDRLAVVQKHLVELVNYLESDLNLTLRDFSREELPSLRPADAMEKATPDAVTSRTAPAKATPAKTAPAKTAKATPAKATPAKATPAKATPARATASKATPAKATAGQSAG